MSHLTDARDSVQKVVALLVNRFGSREDVFGHLTDALRQIGEAEAAQVQAVAAVEVVGEGEGPDSDADLGVAFEPQTLVTAATEGPTDSSAVADKAPPEPAKRAGTRRARQPS